MPYEYVCEYCGKLFKVYHKVRRFCSGDCYILGRGPVWNKGKQMSEEYRKKVSEGNIQRFKNPIERLKISLSHQRGDHDEAYKKQSETMLRRYATGEIQPWNKGLTKEEDPRLIVSEKTKRLQSAKSKILWKNPEYRHKVIRNSLKALFGNRPTSLERKFINLIKRYSLPFKYVGDGELIIGSCNPDFVSTDESNLLIEVANRFHHPENYALQRYAIFSKFGFRTCTLWEELFEGADWERKILSYLSEKEFIEQSLSVCRASLARR